MLRDSLRFSHPALQHKAKIINERYANNKHAGDIQIILNEAYQLGLKVAYEQMIKELKQTANAL